MCSMIGYRWKLKERIMLGWMANHLDALMSMKQITAIECRVAE